MTPEFFKPIKTFVLNQGWGTYDPKDYQQFGFTRHNGLDVRLGDGAEVRAPFDGSVVRSGNQPTGGGIFIGFLSDNFYDFPAFTCITPEGVSIPFPAGSYRVLMDFLHLDHPILKLGDNAKCGELLAIADNTGFSTGPHTHIQPRRVTYTNEDLEFVDHNDANGSFDPTQFWSQIFAVDYLNLSTQVFSLKKIISDLMAKVVLFLQKK